MLRIIPRRRSPLLTRAGLAALAPLPVAPAGPDDEFFLLGGDDGSDGTAPDPKTYPDWERSGLLPDPGFPDWELSELLPA